MTKKKVKKVSKVKIFSKVELRNIFRGKGFVLIITRTYGNVTKLQRVHLGHLKKKKIEKKKSQKIF